MGEGLSILDTNLAVILDQNTARKLGLTDEDLFAQVAKEIRRIPGVRQVYEYQLNRSEIAVEDLRHETHRMTSEQGPELIELHGGEEVYPNEKFRGDIEM